MAKDLLIGRAGVEDLETALLAHVADPGLAADVQQLFEAEEEVGFLCLLNGASVMAFLKHVGQLERHPDTRIAFKAFHEGRSKFRNMPWWDNSIWLPFDFKRPGTLKDDSVTFIGSAPALLRELATMQESSSLALGAIPAGYKEMHQDIAAFYQSGAELELDEQGIVQWIWRALFDGAEMAIRSKTALWAGPG